MNRLCAALFLSMGLSVFAPACGSPPASAPAAQAPRQAASASEAADARSGQAKAKEDTASPTMGSIHIDDRIVKACGDLPEPHFEFDSSAIRGAAADHLRAVARCFVDGALKGSRLKLVGRADSRGPSMYNLSLGQDRAASVSRFLQSNGLVKSRVSTMSRGSFDATGADDAGWARDRRVDLVLAD